MRVLLATDAWRPQLNGVARTLGAVVECLESNGDEVRLIEPSAFRTVPLPTYPEIPLAMAGARKVGRIMDRFQPNAVHVATEGPIGVAARRACLRRSWPFTTGFHTRFPEYLKCRSKLPLRVGYAAVRHFHAPSRAVMAPTATVATDLTRRGFLNVKIWTRGVDTSLFRPDGPVAPVDGLPRPIFMNVGRLAVEKGLPDFLDLDLPGSKVVVGDGPARRTLEQRYPAVHFVGAKSGGDLAGWVRAADAFIFPSRTDTFGLVMLEALASGVPVAAFPVSGPLDVVGGSGVAVLDDDLGAAALAALDISPEACVAYASRFSWRETASMFRAWLAPIR